MGRGFQPGPFRIAEVSFASPPLPPPPGGCPGRGGGGGGDGLQAGMSGYGGDGHRSRETISSERGGGANRRSEEEEQERTEFAGRRGAVIAFDYGATAGRRRSRSPRQKRAAQQQEVAADRRQQKREQRKALWSGPGGANASSRSTGADTASPGELAASSGACTQGGSGSGSNQEKFLRLMGAKNLQPGDSRIANLEGGGRDLRQESRTLERQFAQGMRQRGSRGLGLGAF
eukprot:TRINITY_DN21513_c0_g1_i2.p1 TRINITY_DN21513_c0_g1~~TRINITY_DN21513_c0_g1_i2.p1  ORF type:complete len:231 (-),score=5.93 TRINITY_DN21513_c0_g1_i2:14-706(-)